MKCFALFTELDQFSNSLFLKDAGKTRYNAVFVAEQVNIAFTFYEGKNIVMYCNSVQCVHHCFSHDTASAAIIVCNNTDCQ